MTAFFSVGAAMPRPVQVFAMFAAAGMLAPPDVLAQAPTSPPEPGTFWLEGLQDALEGKAAWYMQKEENGRSRVQVCLRDGPTSVTIGFALGHPETGETYPVAHPRGQTLRLPDLLGLPGAQVVVGTVQLGPLTGRVRSLGALIADSGQVVVQVAAGDRIVATMEVFASGYIDNEPLSGTFVGQFSAQFESYEFCAARSDP